MRELQDDYVIHLNGSGAKTVRSVAVNELGARGYAKSHVTALDTEAVRFMYQDTQRVLAERGITKVKLLRGIRPNGAVVEGHSTESWTTDIRIAKRFAGRGGQILEREVPAADILMWHEHPLWRDGKYGAQSEYIVIRRPE